ncbi:MAG: 3'-5' exonuclease [Methanomicrobiaceae archaeon]|nr:3'-5' exonuclease [Methanomicrobiaceae archaeon]
MPPAELPPEHPGFRTRRLPADLLRYLIFDTETAGLPRGRRRYSRTSVQWPRLVQIAWIVFDENENAVERNAAIIQPQGFTIPAEAARIHGITTELAYAKGIPLRTALLEFSWAAERSTVAVAHNMAFDASVIAAEYAREGLTDPLVRLPKICTMESSAAFCKIRRPGGYKWPALSELHAVLFSSAYGGVHNAADDADACARCFFELKRRGIISGRCKF